MTLAERQKRKREEYTPKEISEHKQKYRRYVTKRNADWQSRTYNEFMDLVTDRLDPTLNIDSAICEACWQLWLTQSFKNFQAAQLQCEKSLGVLRTALTKLTRIRNENSD